MAMKLTAGKLHDMAQTWRAFQRFVEETDQRAGVDVINNAFRLIFSPLGRQSIEATKSDVQEQVRRLIRLLNAETQKAITNKVDIQSLYLQAMRGELRRGLLTRGNSDYPCVDTQIIAQSEHIEAAVNWVLSRSSTNRREMHAIDLDASLGEQSAARAKVAKRAETGIVAAIKNVVTKPKHDVLDLNTLHYLHRSTSNLNTDQRRMATNGLVTEFYGGTALGAALQRHVALKVWQASRLTRHNRFFWYDIAVLQLAGYIIAHGFADGNGRASRLIFACTQIQNGLCFIPPHDDWAQNQIHRRNVDQIIRQDRFQVEQDRIAEEIMDQLI